MNRVSQSTFLCLLSACLAMATGCDDQTHSNPPSPAAPLSGELRQHSSSRPLPLSLNDGKKWRTDDHTRKSIQRMRELIESTSSDSLARDLSGEINQLFEGCQMEGEAHNQLHIFLGELLAHVTGLYASENPQERSEETGAIKELIAAYDSYFE